MRHVQYTRNWQSNRHPMVMPFGATLSLDKLDNKLTKFLIFLVKTASFQPMPTVSISITHVKYTQTRTHEFPWPDQAVL